MNFVGRSKMTNHGTNGSESSDQQRRPPIVGIGASAGGVQALQTFFAALPEQTGAAYVVIVHLDPEAQSQLAPILGAKTSMPVVQVSVPIHLQGDHVYVIPPNRLLHLSDHEVAATPFVDERSRRAPIDEFFRSLAKENEDAYAVVLTGAGSDGSLGVKAVKEAGGIILVQDPKEAEYPSMPRNAIATDVADFVLPVAQLALQLAELTKSRRRVHIAPLEESDEEALRRILAHVRVRTGHDFSHYKRSTVLRRIARRTQITRKEKLGDYYTYLRETPEEAPQLLSDLLISVTASTSPSMPPKN